MRGESRKSLLPQEVEFFNKIIDQIPFFPDGDMQAAVYISHLAGINHVGKAIHVFVAQICIDADALFFGELLAEPDKILLQERLSAGYVDLTSQSKAVEAFNDFGDILNPSKNILVLLTAKAVDALKIAEMAYVPMDFDITMHAVISLKSAGPHILLPPEGGGLIIPSKERYTWKDTGGSHRLLPCKPYYTKFALHYIPYILKKSP